jgi:hypothetical protein
MAMRRRCHEGCNPVATQVLSSAKPFPCRIPLAREAFIQLLVTVYQHFQLN